MKKFLFVVLVMSSVNLLGQINLPVANQTSDWRLGGGLGLNFGSDDYFGIAITPFLGYEITPEVEAGVLVGYQYSSWKYSKQNLFNAGPYINIYPIANLFLRVNYEYYTGSNKIKSTNQQFDFNEDALWVGIGYRSTGRVQFYTGLMYNVLYDDSSVIFSNGLRPIVGVSVGL